MDNIELDDLGNRGEDRPPEDDRGKEGTTLDGDWGSENVLDMSIDPDIRGNLDATRMADRELGVTIGGKKRTITWVKKAIFRKLNINVKKGDGPNSELLFERLGLISTVPSSTASRSSFKWVRDWCSRRTLKKFPSSTSLTA